jgi:hypothetical protein
VNIVVVNSTPLIYLAAIGRFDLLHALYGRIHIPQAVYDEVVIQGTGRWGAAETAQATWIDRHTIADPGKAATLQANLDLGESEVIVLAEQLHANLAIMDETVGRQELKRRGIGFIGTVGVLMSAKHRGIITALKPELDHLRAYGFHLSDHVYQTCLGLVGE